MGMILALNIQWPDNIPAVNHRGKNKNDYNKIPNLFYLK